MLSISIAMTLAFATVALAADGAWGEDGAINAINLSSNGDIRQPSLALNSNNQAMVAWSNLGEQAGSARGIHMSQAQAGATPVVLAATGTQEAWAPNLIYRGTQLYATWMQGSLASTNQVGAVMQQDVGLSAAKTVMTPTYGETSPKLLVGEDRLHIFFASATSRAQFSQAHLYYSNRPYAAAQWLVPTIIVNNAQVSPTPGYGGIWHPQAALSTNKQTVHVVWEQAGGTLDVRSVWYVQGQWQAALNSFAWSTPIRLSPDTQMGVRPKITVDGADRVHVTWVEQQFVPNPIDPTKRVTLQYINYRRLEGGQWSPALGQVGMRLDTQAVQVNTYRPTWSTISMDALGNSVCVAWHGYRGDPGESGVEEILMRCSKDGGKTWTRVANASQTVGLSFFPSLKLGANEQIYLAWEEHQGGLVYTTNYDAYFRQGPLPRAKLYLPLTLRGYSP